MFEASHRSAAARLAVREQLFAHRKEPDRPLRAATRAMGQSGTFVGLESCRLCFSITDDDECYADALRTMTNVMLKHNPPLPLDRALQLHAAALAVLGAVFIGLGRDSAFVPGLAALAAVAAVAVTDLLGWLKLHRWIANLLAIAAVT